MKQYPRFISLVGGIIAFFSFALPWVDIHSGVELAISGFHFILVILMIPIGLIAIGIFTFQSISKMQGTIIITICLFFFLILLSVFFEVVNENDLGSSFITIAFFMSSFIIGSSLILNRQGHWHSFASTFVFTNAAVGIFCFLIVVFSLNLNLRIEGSLNPEIKYGAFLAAVGFILSIVGVLETPYRLENEDTDTDENQSNA